MPFFTQPLSTDAQPAAASSSPAAAAAAASSSSASSSSIPVSEDAKTKIRASKCYVYSTLNALLQWGALKPDQLGLKTDLRTGNAIVDAIPESIGGGPQSTLNELMNQRILSGRWSVMQTREGEREKFLSYAKASEHKMPVILATKVTDRKAKTKTPSEHWIYLTDLRENQLVAEDQQNSARGDLLFDKVNFSCTVGDRFTYEITKVAVIVNDTKVNGRTQSDIVSGVSASLDRLATPKK